jgi:FkbM family methyltransferase
MLPPMISYAQNYEDVALRRAFANQKSGFYVDVGAADPYYDSVTHWFYTAGWSGINIEPLHHWFTEFQVQRPRDTNLNVGIGRERGLRSFYEVSNQGLSTFDDVAADAAAALGYTVAKHQVEVRTLADICHEFRPRRIDFLKVDAEGWEAEVLQGSDWRAYRPRVVLVEATRPNTQEPAHEEWESILTEAGYEFAWFDCLNRFYVRSEEPALKESLARPPSYFDNFRPARAVELERRLEQALKGEGACTRPGRRSSNGGCNRP